MYIEQLYTNCLAEAAYYIESNGQAAIIDPLRETTPYIELARQRGATIKYIFETHFHADFVSGHIDLAKATGAQIIYGPLANTAYSVYNAKHQERFALGQLSIEALHTPGHTPESTCYLLYNDQQEPHALFTGDTLFVGDVGRPDLLDGKMSKEELAGMMYDSLQNIILPLPDHLLVYPAHGPGSACGKNIGKETHSTLGQQKLTNYALQKQSKEAFIEKLTHGMLPPPAYFFEDARINKEGYQNIDAVLQNGNQALSLEAFEAATQNGALVLDTRTPNDFEQGHVPGALNIGLNGQFAVWVGTLVNINTPLVLVSQPGTEQEAVLRLARVGYENVKGFLQGSIATWQQAGKPLATVQSITPEQLVQQAQAPQHVVLDVRKPGEYESGHVKGALHIPLANLNEQASTLDPEKTYLIHCAGGYRSMVAAAMLKQKGLHKVQNVYGGYGKIKHTAIPLEQPEVAGA